MNLPDIRSRLRLRCVRIGLSKIGMTAGRLCKLLKIDSHRVMDTFIQNKKTQPVIPLFKFRLGLWRLLLAHSDVLVVSHATKEFREAIERRYHGTTVIDLAQLYTNPPSNRYYQGLS